jgi:hypothetical protein
MVRVRSSRAIRCGREIELAHPLIACSYRVRRPRTQRGGMPVVVDKQTNPRDTQSHG